MNKLNRDAIILGLVVGLSTYLFGGNSLYLAGVGFAITSGLFYFINRNKPKYKSKE